MNEIRANTISRMTKQRSIILDELSRLKTHPTADILHKIVKKKIPNISLGTVYRNLECLSNAGTIQKLDGGAQNRFDANNKTHYHFRCVRCERVDDVNIEPIKFIPMAMRGIKNYTLLNYRLEFIGLCPRCNETRPA